MPNQSAPGFGGGFVRGGFGQGVPGQDALRQLQQQLAMAQAYGANPAVMADLQLKNQWAMQDQQRRNQLDYMNRMRGQQTRSMGHTSRQVNLADPFLQAIWQVGLGLGGGGGGSLVG